MNRFLIWDFDGTLARRPGGWSGALEAAARQHAPELDITADRVRPYLQSGFPWHAPECAHPDLTPEDWWADMQVVFARAFRSAGASPAVARQLAAQVRRLYTSPTEWDLFDDTLPTLNVLTQNGWRHILLSNHIPELPLLLDHLKLSPHFEAVFNSAQTGWEKPNGHAFRLAQDWIAAHADGDSPIECSMIGDSLKADVVGAQEAGLRAILVRKREPGIPSCESLSELFSML